MEGNRHTSLGLSDEQVVDMYKIMLLARRIDERMWLLNRAGKIPFVVSGQGQEAAQVGASFAMDRSKDYVLPYYRDMGIILSFGMTTRELFLSVFAKKEDPNSGGRQMPGHYGGKKYRIVSGSSPVTTQVPHAAGLALAAQMEGKDFVSLVCFGEGSSNQGDFHEGINFASVHKLPVVFFCENNKYAISVPLKKQLACESVADRAIGYGIPGKRVDGNDVLEVYRVVKEAVDRARNGEGPTLIEAVCHRLTAHTSDDDDSLYRPAEELQEARKTDPLVLFRTYLQEQGLLTEQIEQELEEQFAREIDAETEYADQAPFAEPEETLNHVYEE